MKKQQGQKKQKRNLTGLPQIESSLFNQTIIINNPNININYIDGNQQGQGQQKNIKAGQKTFYNQKDRGVEEWNLNKKIKQFSETRQLGFFKNGTHNSAHKTKNLSPYLIHKTRTQDIRHPTKQLPKQSPSSFRQLNTLTIKKETLAPLEKEEISERNDWRKRLIPKTKKPRDFSSEKTISTLEPYLKGPFTEKKGNASERKAHLNIRKNRFNRVDSSSREKTSQNEQHEKNNPSSKIQNLEDYLVLHQESPKYHSHHSNRQIKKSIQKISSSFMKKVDNYFDDIETVDMPSSKIELYTATLSHPSSLTHENQNHYRSVFKDDQNGYDFGFDEENKVKRPKAHYKRKKMYEEIL